MATKAPAAEAEAPKKGKKMLIIILAVVVLLVALGGGAAVLLLKKKNTGDGEEEADAAPAKHSKVDPHAPPTFLPLDNMVVNLADPGGNRFAQVGITLQLSDAKTGELIKTFMPSIRNGILLLLSQRTTEELLQVQGKEQLAADIIAEISKQLGYEGKRNNPIQAVLFSSFIVQ
jgi:flagellar FliL protein